MENETVETPKVPFFEKHASSILIVTGVLATAAVTTAYVAATVKQTGNHQNFLNKQNITYAGYLEKVLDKLAVPSTNIPTS